MALIKTGVGIAEISGKIGGSVFARNRFGSYVREHTIPVNPDTSRQDAVRTTFSTLAANWRDLLTEAQRTLWEEWALNSPQKNRLGDVFIPTGMNAYISVNAVRPSIPAGFSATPPAEFGLCNPIVPTSSGFTASEGTGLISVDLATSIAGWTDDLDDDMAMFYVSKPVSAATNFIAGPFRFTGQMRGNNGDPFAFPATLTSTYTLVEGQKIRVTIIHVEPEGRHSDKSFVDITVAA